MEWKGGPHGSSTCLQNEWRRQLEQAEEMARASIAAEQNIIAEKEEQIRSMSQQSQEQQVQHTLLSQTIAVMLRLDVGNSI